MEELYNKANS